MNRVPELMISVKITYYLTGNLPIIYCYIASSLALSVSSIICCTVLSVPSIKLHVFKLL